MIIVVFTMCVIIMSANDVSLGDTLAQYPFSIVIAVLCGPAFLFVGIMLTFHSYLIVKNLTTKEFFDGKW